MENTTNYNLKKPDYTDFADIYDLNDNMDTIDDELANPTGDSADSTTTFTSSDVADGSATAWTNITPMTSGETHKSLFAKLSQAIKNLRYLWKLIGTTDISSIGNGTITNALSVLNANGVKSITRSGTTFTVVRNDDTTFTFDQQDNNTWNANSVSVAGYVPAPTASNTRRFYSTDSSGNPAWRNNIYFTAPSSSAAGSSGLVPGSAASNYANRQLMFLRSDAQWGFVPLQNNATTTAEHYALDARMGKTLQANIDEKIKFKTGSATITSIAANSYAGATISNMGISGYTLQGIIYINKTGTNADHVVLTRFFTSDSANNCSLYFKNTSSSAVTNLTVTVNCIYIKN